MNQCAQKSLDEYNEWALDPSAYYPPSPFTYVRPLRNSISLFIGVSEKPPSFDEFQQYGPAIVYSDFQNDAATQAIAAATAKRSQMIVSIVGSAIGAALGPLLLETMVRAVLPFAVRAVGLSVAGATAFAGPFVAVVTVIVGSVFEGIAVTDANQLPGKLAEALTNAQNATIDLNAARKFYRLRK